MGSQRRMARRGLIAALIATGVPLAMTSRATAAADPVQTGNTLVAAAASPEANWGGHQARIVDTPTGLYTTYTSGTEELAQTWHLMRMGADGGWSEVASGGAGREPANLLVGPDGRLFVVASPSGVVTLFTATPTSNGPVTFTSAAIPGSIEGYWQYLSAGIDDVGDLCVVTSNGGNSEIGELYVLCRRAGQTTWNSTMYPTEYRYAYTQVIPRSDGSLLLVNTRDTTWESLGYTMPEGGFEYAFDRFNVWSTDQTGGPLDVLSSVQAIPSRDGEYVVANAQADALVDSQGRLHVLYHFQDSTTGGASNNRHRMIALDGTVLADHEIAADAGFQFMKMIETADGRFWLFLNGAGVREFDPATGASGPTTNIDTSGREVWYSGYSLTSPRTGSPLRNVVDAVYLSNLAEWRHVRVSFGADQPSMVQLDRRLVGGTTSPMTGWGGFQSRVVSGPTGAWTVTVSPAADGSLTWRLLRRRDDGVWATVKTGPSGDQPPNLVVEPDGTLVLFAAPAGRVT